MRFRELKKVFVAVVPVDFHVFFSVIYIYPENLVVKKSFLMWISVVFGCELE